jgi:hypothetical protein
MAAQTPGESEVFWFFFSKKNFFLFVLRKMDCFAALAMTGR